VISAGQLAIRADWRESGLRHLEVSLQRPPVTQMFVGRAPAEVIQSIPLIYTLCAEAQHLAGQGALAAAMGEAFEPPASAGLWIELLHESLWRLLLDWPVALGFAPEKAAFIAWRAARHGDDSLLESRRLLTTTLPALAEKCLEKLAEPSLPASCEAPSFSPEQWLGHFQGTRSLPPAEAPATIRLAFEARLAAVKVAIDALQAAIPYPIALAANAGCGVAQTVTARGVLTHAVRLAAGRVSEYRVWAPTDAFFADAVPLRRLLNGRTFATLADAHQAVNQGVLALDPCLPYTVELTHA
jgi:uptake hydrogenase large subunit